MSRQIYEKLPRDQDRVITSNVQTPDSAHRRFNAAASSRAFSRLGGAPRGEDGAPEFLASLLPVSAPGRATAQIKRDAFLYLDPSGDADRFAQCGTCKEYLSNGDCYLFASPVDADASCGLYVPGRADPDWTSNGRLVTPKEAGYVDRQVRCENCRFFDAPLCELYGALNVAFPNEFDLDPRVNAKGCCNAQTPMIRDHKYDAARRVAYEKAIAADILLAYDFEKSSDHPGGTDLHVLPENAEPIHGIPVVDAVTNANVLHVFVEMVREGKTATKRVVVPLDSLIALQRVVDRQRVLKHMEQLRVTGQIEPGQDPPLVLLWDNDNIIIGGHHGLQAAYNLDLKTAEVDLMVAPT